MLKLLWIACALCIPAFAQVDTALPAETTITNLSGHAQEFDKHLVRVHAVLVFGWEGDNFLLDPSIPAPLYMPSRDPAAVWFYSQAGRDQQVYSPMGGQRIVYGVFEGTFIIRTLKVATEERHSGRQRVIRSWSRSCLRQAQTRLSRTSTETRWIVSPANGATRATLGCVPSSGKLWRRSRALSWRNIAIALIDPCFLIV